jgi:hypothetical protein
MHFSDLSCLSIACVHVVGTVKRMLCRLVYLLNLRSVLDNACNSCWLLLCTPTSHCSPSAPVDRKHNLCTHSCIYIFCSGQIISVETKLVFSNVV